MGAKATTLNTSGIPWFVLLGGAMLAGLVLFGLVASAAEQFDVIARQETGPNRVTSRIDRPNVPQRRTPYPNMHPALPCAGLAGPLQKAQLTIPCLSLDSWQAYHLQRVVC